MPKIKKIENYLGMTFGTRVIIGQCENISGRFSVVVLCACGNTSNVVLNELIKGRARTCKDCSRKFQSGPNSKMWKGSKYISLTVYNNWLKSAKKRKIPWDVSIEYLDFILEKQNFKCNFTGDDLTIGHGSKNGLLKNGTASLDRIDSNLGYIENNVQFVIKQVNICKQTMKDEDFIDLCKKISKYRNNGAN